MDRMTGVEELMLLECATLAAAPDRAVRVVLLLAEAPTPRLGPCLRVCCFFFIGWIGITEVNYDGWLRARRGQCCQSRRRQEKTCFVAPTTSQGTKSEKTTTVQGRRQ